MRAFFQELKTNGRRRTAPQRGGAARSGFDVRRPRWDDPMVLTISAHHQPPPAAWPPCSPSRAPPPTTGAGPAARGTRTQDPGPTNSNDHDPTRTKTFARNTAPTPDPTAPTPRPRSASTIDHTTSGTTSRREARPRDAQARPLLHTSRTTAPSNSRRNARLVVPAAGRDVVGPISARNRTDLEPELNRSRRSRHAAAGPHSLHVLVAGAGNGVANPGHQHRTRYGLRRRRTRPAPARARRSRRWRRRCCCGCSRRRRRRRPGPARRR